LDEEQQCTNSLRQRLLGDNGVEVLKREKSAVENRCAVLESNYLISSRTVEELTRKLEEKDIQLSNTQQELTRKLEEREFELQSTSKELHGLKQHTDSDNDSILLRQQIDSLNRQLGEVSIQSEREKHTIITAYMNEVEMLQQKLDPKDKAPVFVLDDYYKRNDIHMQAQPPTSAPAATPRNVDPEIYNAFQHGDPYRSDKLDAGQLRESLALGKSV
jgi:hypothetical protein